MTENIIDLLRELGSSDKREIREKIIAIPNAREQIYALPVTLTKSKSSAEEIERVIRGVCRIERWAGNHFAEVQGHFIFGSTSVVPSLVQMLDPMSVEQEGALMDWLFSHRTNPYIPFGKHVLLGINSYEEYREYEHKRSVHRVEQSAIDKEKSRRVREQRAEEARAHAERSSNNDILRKVYLKRLYTMTPVERLREIARSDKRANYFPEEYAVVGNDVIADLPASVRLRLWKKTEMMSQKTAWGALSRKLKPPM